MKITQDVLGAIQRLFLIKEWELARADLRDILNALAQNTIIIQRLLNSSHSELNRIGGSEVIRGLVFPEGSNPPPLAGTVKGRTFYNTSRKRYQASFDTWGYYDFPTPESARLYRSTDQTLTTSATAAISFDTEVFDHIALADLAAQPTRITFPISGRYNVGGHLKFEANATGRRSISIRLNGATIITSMNQMAITEAGIVTRCAVATTHEFAASDYIELLALQTSGGDLDVQAEAGNSAIMYAHKLG